jgi:sugar lactone lactonase YvrE
VDDNENVFIVDYGNHCIVEWKCSATRGHVVNDAHGPGNGIYQLNQPTDVIVDKATNSLIICDKGNRRVIRWSLQRRISAEFIIENIDCYGLAMDDLGFLYVSDSEKHEVRRHEIGTMNGTVVAGGNERGNDLNQLDDPRYVFIDRDHSVYVSDHNNHRVMKWLKNAKEGIVVAGNRGQGDDSMQLNHPNGILVDQLGTVYVTDSRNNRVMRWCNEETQGNVTVGGNGRGHQGNQLDYPMGLSFDQYGNLYVVDSRNNRVQRFLIQVT